jgi:glycosyltransferase involved in cell wall biosynthesis
LYPSRLEPQKRQELLIEAMRYTNSPVKAIFAGAVSERSRYETLIRGHGVGDRVRMLGFVDEAKLLRLYEQALAVCYLPFDEDYGYVTLEAMLAERPVIVAKDSGGPTEFIENEVEGFVVEPEPRAIAESLDKLFRDRALARKMGLRGREKIGAMNLSWQHVVERIISAAS